MPELPWTGHYVRVELDRSIKWIRCANCGRKLSDPESQRIGVGPDCFLELAEDELRRVLDLARANDREVWRYDVKLKRWRGGAGMRPYFPESLRGRKPGFVNDGLAAESGRLAPGRRRRRTIEWNPGPYATSDAQERWRKLMEARRRGAS